MGEVTRAMVIPEGLEPPTYRLGICRSILMSYGTTQTPLWPILPVMARCLRRRPALPAKIIVPHAMAAGAEPGLPRLFLASKEDTGAPAHPPSGGTVEAAIDPQSPVATITHMARRDQPTQVIIVNGVMADHPPPRSAAAWPAA